MGDGWRKAGLSGAVQRMVWCRAKTDLAPCNGLVPPRSRAMVSQRPAAPSLGEGDSPLTTMTQEATMQHKAFPFPHNRLEVFQYLPGDGLTGQASRRQSPEGTQVTGGSATRPQ